MIRSCFLRNVGTIRLMTWEGDDHCKATWITVSLAESNLSSVGVDHMIHDGQPQAAMALPAPC